MRIITENWYIQTISDSNQQKRKNMNIIKFMKPEKIIKICKAITKTLSVLDSEKKSPTVRSGTYLIFPHKRDAEKRISEQEFRVLFIQELEKQKIFYSIETPSEKVQGKEKRCGCIDLTIFDKKGQNYERAVNVEFKFGHNKNQIEKDLKKLTRENRSGAFIMVLEKATDRTWKSIDSKIRSHFDKYKNILIIACAIESNEVRAIPPTVIPANKI